MTFIVKNTVDHPDKVILDQQETDGRIVFSLQVVKEDVGKVIGKSGSHAMALRTLLTSVAAKEGKRVQLKSPIDCLFPCRLLIQCKIALQSPNLKPVHSTFGIIATLPKLHVVGVGGCVVVFLLIYFFLPPRNEKWFRNQDSTPKERVII